MISLDAKPRKEIGRGLKELRNKKILPAVLYGKDAKNIPINIDYQKFQEVYEKAGESTIVKIKVISEKGEKEYPTIIREVQKDPTGDNYIHADFFQIPMNEELEVTVPLEFEGEAPAEKELGGILIKNIHEVDIKALPQNLIHSIKVDVSSLANFEDEIKIKELTIPEGVTILADPEEIVAVIGRPKEEKVEEAPEEKEKIEEVEVIGKEKEEEEAETEKEEKQSPEKEESKKS